ncbi:MAG: glycosyltransferase family 2 protein [Tepidisphaeraceae bacterium]
MTTLPRANLLVSFVMATRNRRDVLLDTLGHIQRCGLRSEAFETIVVDNASTDRTVAAVRESFPGVTILEEPTNRGSCAKNLALPLAQGRLVMFLDDDSYPQPGSMQRVIRHFEADPGLGAAVFDVVLPDGSRECSAYPDVFIGCGTAFRKRALAQVGGLPEDFFMQAEEYDLSLRLLDAGWSIRRFDDVRVSHRKTQRSRCSGRTARLDARNCVLLAARRFPSEWFRPFIRDWLGRYWLLASASGHRLAMLTGALQGLVGALNPFPRRPIKPATFDQFARIGQIESTMRTAVREYRLKRVIFVDLGKNVFPFWLAAQRCGLKVVAIADNRLAPLNARYRGVPIVSDDVALQMPFDGVIIANLSPVHARARRAQWRKSDVRPVLEVLESDFECSLTISDAVRAASESRQTAARIA